MASTPGKFMNSAKPDAAGWARSGSRSATSSLAPAVSNSVAGTQELRLTRSVMARLSAGLEKVADAGRAQHIGDLMRVADGRGGAARQDALLELGRHHQRALDMEVGIDEAGHDEAAAGIDLAPSAIGRRGCRRSGHRRSRCRRRRWCRWRCSGSVRCGSTRSAGSRPAPLVDPPAQLMRAHRGPRTSASFGGRSGRAGARSWPGRCSSRRPGRRRAAGQPVAQRAQQRLPSPQHRPAPAPASARREASRIASIMRRVLDPHDLVDEPAAQAETVGQGVGRPQAVGDGRDPLDLSAGCRRRSCATCCRHPSGSTPMDRQLGLQLLDRAADMPAIRPPPPIGTRTASRCRHLLQPLEPERGRA